MASIKLYTELLEDGWIKLNIRAKARSRFIYALEKLRKIPVITFQRKEKYHKTSIFYFEQLQELCARQNWDFYYSKKLKKYYKRFKLRQERIKNVNGKFESKYWTEDPNFQPHKYQIKAINICLKAKRYLIGDDMGVGKTIEALGIICKAFEEGYDRALIVVLNRIKYQWKEEIKQFTKFTDEDISVVDFSRQLGCPLKLVEKFSLRSKECKVCKLQRKCLKLRENPQAKRKHQFEQGKIVICNFEILSKSKEFIIRQGFDIVIVDEASKMKNRGTEITKSLLHIRKNLPKNGFYIPMSGTFIENRLEELWGPFSFADPRILGEFYNFKNNYLIFDYWGNVSGYKNTKQLKKIIKGHIIRRSIDQVWKNRPKLTEITRTCEMTVKQREIYNKARDGVLDQLNDLKSQDKINKASILPLLNYLIQICDTTETQDETIFESGKLDVLKDIIENEIHPKHKIIIFSFFANKVIPIIKREIRPYGRVVTIVGGLKPKQFEKRKNKFINNKNIRFAICSDSMAYGQNMQAANYVINFDLLWNPQKMEQRLRRVYRKGQKKPVTLINLVTTNSIEDRMLEVLGERKQLFSEFLGTKRKKTSVDQLLKLFT